MRAITRHAHLFWECLRRAGELVARELVHRRLCKCISIRVSVRAYVQVQGRLYKCIGVYVSAWEYVQVYRRMCKYMRVRVSAWEPVA